MSETKHAQAKHVPPTWKDGCNQKHPVVLEAGTYQLGDKTYVTIHGYAHLKKRVAKGHLTYEQCWKWEYGNYMYALQYCRENPLDQLIVCVRSHEGANKVIWVYTK